MISYLVIGQILIASSLVAFYYGNKGDYGKVFVKAVGYGLLLLGITFVADFYMGLV